MNGNLQFCPIDVSQMRGFAMTEDSPEKSQTSSRANPSVRFYAKIAEKPESL